MIAPSQPQPAARPEQPSPTSGHVRVGLMSTWAERIERARAAAPARWRLLLTGVSAVYAVAGVSWGLVLFVAATVALAVVPIGLGVVGCVALAPALARWAGRYREAGSLLTGREVVVAYRAAADEGVWSRAQAYAADPQRWRDVAHTFVAATAGFVLSTLVVALLLAPGVHVVQAALAGGLTAWLYLALAVAEITTWWFATPFLVRWRARLDLAVLIESRTRVLERRVDEVTQTRSESLDAAAAELRRIERDLHDGAQARLVSLGMNLGLAESALRDDPEAAAALMREAQDHTRAALDELRAVLTHIHPPVLADRGLVGAIEAAALDAAIDVEVRADRAIALEAPVEAAVYFAVVELLTNTVKHSGASRVEVALRHDGTQLRATVTDDGRGGAALEGGSGLRGIVRRLAAFDGTLAVHSPVSGPTVITLEVPCEPSSPTTTR